MYGVSQASHPRMIELRDRGGGVCLPEQLPCDARGDILSGWGDRRLQKTGSRQPTVGCGLHMRVLGPKLAQEQRPYPPSVWKNPER